MDIRVTVSYSATPQITPRDSGKVKACDKTEVPRTTFEGFEQVRIIGREFNLEVFDNVTYQGLKEIPAPNVKPATPTSYPDSESAFLLRITYQNHKQASEMRKPLHSSSIHCDSGFGLKEMHRLKRETNRSLSPWHQLSLGFAPAPMEAVWVLILSIV